MYGEENKLEDENICYKIKKITIKNGSLYYFPDAMLDEDTREELLSYIDGTFDDGRDTIYFKSLFETFEERFECSKIYDENALKSYLEYYMGNKYFFYRAYMSKSGAKENVLDEIAEYLLTCGCPVKENEICEGLPHISKNKISQNLKFNRNKMILNKKAKSKGESEFFNADIVEISDYELETVKNEIQRNIEQYQYMTAKELIEFVHRGMPDFVDQNPFLTDTGIKNFFSYKLKGSFAFNGNVISRLYDGLRKGEIYSSFGEKYKSFTIEQLKSFESETELIIHFESLYKNAVRVSKTNFVSKDRVYFDIEAVDDWLDKICEGNFIGLKEIPTYELFPDCGYRWNAFLLECYTMYYSKRFKLLHKGFRESSALGIIVRKSLEIDDFDEALARALAESSIDIDEKTALDYFNSCGFISTKKHKSIGNIVAKARLYRKNEGV